MKARIYLIFFFLISIVDIINVWADLPYRHFTKSLIIPLLILYFIAKTPKVKTFYVFVIALVFAWLGDVFLLFSGANFFQLGLASFLVMQLIYSYLFFKDIEFQIIRFLTCAFLLGIFCLVFNTYLWSYTSGIRIPVVVYSAAIALMAFTGINRNLKLKGYNYIVYGVLLFVISDSILAMVNFAQVFQKGGFLVMLTYILAQYFITEGYSRHLGSSVERELTNSNPLQEVH